MANYFSTTLRIARKEFRGFFATPAAYLFLGGFLAVTLFVFFWVETFFARNIADVRPLFQWLPLLLIFLVAALTMRAWSEERRAGTLESLLTAPVSPLQLILGKFTAALGLVALALALTLPLPVTVFLLGPLDWGPVIGGYVATLFLAAAYVAIGLYMSGRTDNPIVALILTAVVCGLFYLIGSSTLTTLFDHEIGNLLALLGTGTRFESITRGVLDLRDLYYYLSIVGVFLTLNLFSLERLRWAGNPISPRHRLWGWAARLAAANFIAANLWLNPIGWARADITAEKQYTLSEATENQLAALQEPLLIRGYFSAKTHPLLAPLVPRIKDLLDEYAVASGGHARVEFVDPTRDREAEEEAASRYGIKPVPFQTADRYQAAVVSAYFDLVIAYGDQYETLGYRDLIEVKARGERDLDVVLKNPEYAITRAIRKVAGSYRAGGNPFEALQQPVVFKGYMSHDEQLPETLRELRGDLKGLLDDLEKQAGDKLTVQFADPDAGGGKLAAELKQKYGFGPQIASLFDPKPFWFYMVLEGDGEALQVPLPETLDKPSLERSLNAALQRLTPGALKTVALIKPQAFGPGGQRYGGLEEVLGENVRIKKNDLKSGQAPEDADLLLVMAPKELDEKQRFAIDQFLMQGGSVVMVTSPFDVQVSGTLNASKQASGLDEWLAYHGVTIDETMVLDQQNAALPVPTDRYIGGLALREIRMLPYPHFPDLRGDGLNPDNPITASLGQLTLNWASPIQVDADKNQARKVIELLHSSENSWTSDSLDLVPDYRAHPDTGFSVSGERKPQLLAVAIEGRFDSFYQGKESPLAKAEEKDDEATDEGDKDGSVQTDEKEAEQRITGVIERSPESARLILVASNTFASDAAIDLASQGLNTLYTKPLAFMQNAIDWSLEDRGLLALRGRTQLARTLDPMSDGEQQVWEWINYGLALLGLLAVWGWRRRVAAADAQGYNVVLAEV
ncbi:MAG: ABC transporter permease [Candidatus Sedimenticola endophacoides]|uniref:ABC transporter permease n=1 Tax=Candidatus Sedimenticola endophacoides TaxID=2548426 RepID=A0A6N4DTG4_9GAMM|nr:MAG: ABC transporter permease [Candidatus Sedimenticola endophacoides]OQX48921.1 MAG: ABC transporter permease [Candidatus Sedimenticola endophacoides]PUE00126.1 MAG: ABC transporter permease [Candidatus Sedimenticola endophacoides]PUE00264.1 MAG: ABC transporter permease [Candidatus Sedimenticola endophacoides]PUE03934.1 MAG: ABC transporter permease [Candidatus Sedimenticola endophacoides]